jgi:hypothetical protein
MVGREAMSPIHRQVEIIIATGVSKSAMLSYSDAASQKLEHNALVARFTDFRHSGVGPF